MVIFTSYLEIENDLWTVETSFVLNARVKYLHGIPWISMELPCSSKEFHGVSMEFHGVSMEFHGVFMEFHGFLWNFMDFHRIPWISMEFYGKCYELLLTLLIIEYF